MAKSDKCSDYHSFHLLFYYFWWQYSLVDSNRKYINISGIASAAYVIREIPLWLTLRALVWCSLQRTAPCVSSSSGNGCCWAGWQATTRPSTWVLRPGGPPSWLCWSGKRNPDVPLRCVSVQPRESHSRPCPLLAHPYSSSSTHSAPSLSRSFIS